MPRCRTRPMARCCASVSGVAFAPPVGTIRLVETKAQGGNHAHSDVPQEARPGGLTPYSAHESTIMSRDKNSHLRLAGRSADYQKLGIDPVEVAQFEDGQRIGTEKGRYEWWYFDAHLDDGASVVVVFWTKPNVSPNGPLAPRITIDLTLPDGRRFEKFYDTTADQFTASKEGCDVRIGTNRFVGDLRRYRITAAIEEISVEIELTGEVRAWRPKSGHLYFGVEGRETLFAWLPSVPQGVAHVRCKIGHEEYRASGSGYHDHNWGNVPMQTADSMG